MKQLGKHLEWDKSDQTLGRVHLSDNSAVVVLKIFSTAECHAVGLFHIILIRWLKSGRATERNSIKRLDRSGTDQGGLTSIKGSA